MTKINILAGFGGGQNFGGVQSLSRGLNVASSVFSTRGVVPASHPKTHHARRAARGVYYIFEQSRQKARWTAGANFDSSG